MWRRSAGEQCATPHVTGRDPADVPATRDAGSQHAPYFHNGVAATLEAVVDLYNTRKGLNFTTQQKADLVQYLKSL
jgi:cytochrome c peroxidase